MAMLVPRVVGILAIRWGKIALPYAQILIRLLLNGRRIVGRILDLLGHGWGGPVAKRRPGIIPGLR
jgi:hypothetical protein